MTINGKKYHAEYFCKCELCDLRGADGECGMSDNMTCEDNEIYKLEEDEND